MVTVWPMPSGLPTASTTSPTLTRSESPSATDRQIAGASIFSTARSLGLSVPTTLAVSVAAVGQLDLDVVRAVDDVVVGQDVAVARDDRRRSRGRAASAPAACAASAGRADHRRRTALRRTAAACRWGPGRPARPLHPRRRTSWASSSPCPRSGWSPPPAPRRRRRRRRSRVRPRCCARSASRSSPTWCLPSAYPTPPDRATPRPSSARPPPVTASRRLFHNSLSVLSSL